MVNHTVPIGTTGMLDVPKTLKITEYDSVLRAKLVEQRKNGEFIDCIIHVKFGETTETYKVHRVILAAGSQYFKTLFDENKLEAVSEINLSIRAENALCCFESLLSFLYTGSLDMSKCTPIQMAKIAKLYEVNDAVELLHPYIQEIPTINPKILPALFSSMLLPSQSSTLDLLLQSTAQKLKENQLNGKLLDLENEILPLAQPLLGSKIYDNSLATLNFLSADQQQNDQLPNDSSKRRKRTGSQESGISEKSVKMSLCDEIQENTADPFGQSSDIIVPSNDREGWCRNKKYIEQVKDGYMCTVCKKIYGRYNSVSYHVTIYHRNPPIKCDIEGCDFSTREARYIHFHKYYRHHINLPDTIDLGCRKCQYCAHVSKSPAMLQKHISRHLNETGKDGLDREYTTVKKAKVADEITDEHRDSETNIPSYPCNHCNYRGQSETLLKQHLLFKHSQDTFERKLSCEVCQYVCAKSKMHIHYKDRHPGYKQDVDNDDVQSTFDEVEKAPESNSLSVVVS